MPILYTGNGGHVEGAGSGGTIAVTLTGVVAADGIVGSVTFDTTATTTVSVSDGTTTANADKQRNSTNLGQANAAWSIPNSPAGSRTFTATFGASSTSRGIQAMEFSGLPTAAGSFVTGTPASNDSGAGTATAFDNTTSTTPLVAGALIFQIGEYQTQQPVNAGSFSVLENDASNDVTTGYLVQGAAAAVSPSFTGAAAQVWAVVIVAYAPAVAAGGVPFRAWPQPLEKKSAGPDLIPLPAVQRSQAGVATSRFLVPAPQPLDKKVAAPDLIPLPPVKVSQAGIAAAVAPNPKVAPYVLWKGFDLIPVVLAKVNVGTSAVAAAPPFAPVPSLVWKMLDLIGVPPVKTSQAGIAAAVAPLTVFPYVLWKAFDLIPLPAVQASQAGQAAAVVPLTPVPPVLFRAPDLIPLPAVQASQAGQPGPVAPFARQPQAMWTPPAQPISVVVQAFQGIAQVVALPPFAALASLVFRALDLIPLPPVQQSQAGQPGPVFPPRPVPMAPPTVVPMPAPLRFMPPVVGFVAASLAYWIHRLVLAMLGYATHTATVVFAASQQLVLALQTSQSVALVLRTTQTMTLAFKGMNMPPLQQQSIVGFVAGNKLDVFRVVSAIPTGRTLVKCYLTIKAKITDVDPGIIQKTILTSTGAGVGTITAIGDGTGGQPLGTGAFFFEFTTADTLAIGTPKYVYDIKMIFDNGDVATLEVGTFQLVQGVTTINS